MKYYSDYRLVELIYEDTLYEHLEFIRIDHICEVCYITLKNVITTEIFPFEQHQIKSIRKKIYRYPQSSTKNKNHVAATS
ncbi:hypothetical protein V7122_23780 [Bacillus sp. JJ1532]|uniref:hypothetical protein n=1 Tax=unclassified Bacillus (in: firmicutes) TaxID=185979 RepID=UPI003000B5CD